MKTTKPLELGCLYLNPYEFYSPDGKHVECRYDIVDFYRYNCICHTNACYHEEKFTALDFELDSDDDAQSRLGSAIIKLWWECLITRYPKVNKMTIKDNKTAIKIHDNKENLDFYMGWYDGTLTVTVNPPSWYGKPWPSINLQQYR